MGLSSPAKRPDIMEEARGRWASLLPRFGISPAHLTGKHSPCPLCGGRDRFRFDDRGGNGTYICNQCGAGNGIRLVMLKTGLSFADAAAELRRYIPSSTKSVRRESRRAIDNNTVRQLWNDAIPLMGTIADRYLALRGVDGDTSALRFLPGCPISDIPGISRCDAMLAMVSGPDGKPVSLHRTYLDGPAKAAYRDGSGRVMSARRLMPGALPKGAAVRLAIADDELGIGEGIETARAAHRLFNIPCWATINSTLMQQFVPPPHVKRLVIFGDNDPKFGGQAAAYAAAHRIACSRHRPDFIEVHIPSKVGDDFNDVLMGRLNG